MSLFLWINTIKQENRTMGSVTTVWFPTLRKSLRLANVLAWCDRLINVSFNAPLSRLCWMILSIFSVLNQVIDFSTNSPESNSCKFVRFWRSLQSLWKWLLPISWCCLLVLLWFFVYEDNTSWYLGEAYIQ